MSAGPLEARPDGLLGGRRLVTLPFMAPRLQGELHPSGRLDLSAWGVGTLGAVRFAPPRGPFVYGPNRVTWPAGGVFVAQSRPAILVRGFGRHRISPALRPAPWALRAKATPVVREGQRRTAEMGWGAIVTEVRGADLVIAAGEDLGEALSGLSLSAERIVGEAAVHAGACDALPEADPILRGMVTAGAHAALSSVRRDCPGGFAGLAAGLAYSAPARTYYRDGYWTMQALLRLRPEAARQAIDLLADGVHDDGEAPSGVVMTQLSQCGSWEQHRLSDPRAAAAHLAPADWWSDHFDSPLFFVLAVADYVAATGEADVAVRHWPRIRAVFRRYQRLSKDGLPEKPRHDRDWADNVFRAGTVAYDVGLWIGALEAMVRLGREHDPSLAAEAKAARVTARTAVNGRLWQGRWYADYRAPDGFTEAHLALDSLTLLRHGAAPNARALQVLAAVRADLESRHNPHQPWGDWGVLCAWPPFSRRADLRAKTAFPFRYHNGADWPWLDGLYAGERLARGLPGWRYPLTRWWQTSLRESWAGATEYFSPPFGRGSLLQAWSSHPAAVALKHRDRVLAGDPDAVRAAAPASP